MFNSIIGYDDIKKLLERIIDCLNNTEKYNKLGCNTPHGLLLYGEPGLGKTSIAEEFIKNVKREKYIIRKNKSDGDFISHITDVFNQAKNNQPSIILLDDLDKFAEVEDEANNQEEFVAIQSCIDEVKGLDVFVIATVNDKSVLPNSLLRSGRFDIIQKVDYPKEKELFKIFSYYLSTKAIDKDVDTKKLACILSHSSCAELEKVCNQAGIYAGFNNKEKIGMEELLRAALELKYDTNIEELKKEGKYDLNNAYHEAGHTIIGELLEPGSIAFVTVKSTDSNTKGLTTYHNNEYYFEDIDFMKNRLKALLGGKAATEIVYGKCDTGAGSDLGRAYDLADRFVDCYCMLNFNSYMASKYDAAEEVKNNKDIAISNLISEYYNEVKEMLIKNRDLLDKMAIELKEKTILFKEDIQNIMRKHINKKNSFI